MALQWGKCSITQLKDANGIQGLLKVPISSRSGCVVSSVCVETLVKEGWLECVHAGDSETTSDRILSREDKERLDTDSTQLVTTTSSRRRPKNVDNCYDKTVDSGQVIYYMEETDGANDDRSLLHRRRQKRKIMLLSEELSLKSARTDVRSRHDR